MLRLEAQHVSLRDLDLGPIFNQYDPVVFRDKPCEGRKQRGLARSGSAADKDVLLGDDICLEPPRQCRVKRSGLNQISCFKLPFAEFADSERYASVTVWRERRGNARPHGGPLT